MQLIDPEFIQTWSHYDGAFHYPDWAAVWERIESNAGALDREVAWNEAGALWLQILREDLGSNYRLHQSRFSFLLCDQPEREATRLLAFLDKSVTQIKEMIGDAAWQGGFGKRAALVFGELDDYYQYVSHYSMDGEQAASGGVSIGHGFSHIALPWSTGESVAGVMIHELAHDSLAHLPVPHWLNEGIAQALERKLSDLPRDVQLDGELAERHFSYWTAATIQEFWAGTAFFQPGEPSELSYSLAEILFSLLLQESARSGFPDFLIHISTEDGGQHAAMTYLNLDLGALAGTFLSPGEWRPQRKEIVEVWELAGWRMPESAKEG